MGNFCDANTFWFWAASNDFSTDNDPVFLFSFKDRPLNFGSTNVLSNADTGVGIATAFFQNKYYAIMWKTDTSPNPFINKLYVASAPPTNIATTWNLTDDTANASWAAAV